MEQSTSKSKVMLGIGAFGLIIGVIITAVFLSRLIDSVR